jgi:hypothetical protein
MRTNRPKGSGRTEAVAPETAIVPEVVASSALGYGLVRRQAQFLTELLSAPTFDPTAAAIRVGVPEGQARDWGRMMLEAPAVRDALHAQLQAQIEGAQATPARWLQEVARLALVDFDKSAFYLPDGTLKSPTEWTPEMSSWVDGWEVEELWVGRGESREFLGHVKKIKLSSAKRAKLQALELLAKYHKLYADTAPPAIPQQCVTGGTVNVQNNYLCLSAEEAARLYREQVQG